MACQKLKTVFECKLWSDKYKSTDYSTRVTQVGRYIHFSVLRPRSFQHDVAGSICKSDTGSAFATANRKHMMVARAVRRANTGPSSALVVGGERKQVCTVPAKQRTRSMPRDGKTSTCRKRVAESADACCNSGRRRKLDCKTPCETCPKPHEEVVGARTNAEGDASPKPVTDSSGSMAIAVTQSACGC
jgi:ribosomal protein S30